MESDAGAYTVQIADANTNVLVSDPAVITIARGLPLLGIVGLTLLLTALLFGGAIVRARR